MSVFRIFSGFPFEKNKAMTGMALCLIILCGSLFLTYQIRSDFPDFKGFQLASPFIIISLMVISFLLFALSRNITVILLSLSLAMLSAVALILLTIEVNGSVDECQDYVARKGPGTYVAYVFTPMFLFYNLSGYFFLTKHR